MVIALTPHQRQGLRQLIDEITEYMIAQLELPPEDLESLEEDSILFEHPDSTSQPSLSSSQTFSSKDRDGGSSSAKRDQKPQQKLTGKAAKKAEQIQKAAIRHMASWKNEFMLKLEEIIKVEDNDKIKAERKKRAEEVAKRAREVPEDGENLIHFGEVTIYRSEDVETLQALYHPIPNELTRLPIQDRREALSCILLVLLSTGKYSSHSRTLALYLASALELSQTFLGRRRLRSQSLSLKIQRLIRGRRMPCQLKPRRQNDSRITSLADTGKLDLRLWQELP